MASSILSSSEYDNVYGQPMAIDTFWTPTEQDTKLINSSLLLTALKKFIATTNDDWEIAETKKVIEDLGSYHIQYIGVVVDDKKMLFCNAIQKEDTEEEGYESGELYVVFDGGHWYWQAILDPQSESFIMFRSNGES